LEIEMALTVVFKKMGTLGPFRCEVVSFNKSGADTEETFVTQIREVRGIATGAGALGINTGYTTAADGVVTINVTFPAVTARRLTVMVLGF
jgi:hypothetical protein